MTEITRGIGPSVSQLTHTAGDPSYRHRSRPQEKELTMHPTINMYLARSIESERRRIARRRRVSLRRRA